MGKHNEHMVLDSLLDSFFNEKMNLIFTSQPATIVEFHKEENTVKVSLDKENITLDDIPISLFGNTKSFITTPTLEKGTKGILIFSKHDLNTWIGEGIDPHAKNDFSKNNAFFLIGLTNHQKLIKYNTEAIEIRSHKGIETYSKNNTDINSEKQIKASATKEVILEAGTNIVLVAGEDLNNEAVNITLIGSASIVLEAPSVSLTSPAITLGGGSISMGGGAGAGSMAIASKNGDDLATLLEELSRELSSFSEMISISNTGAVPYIAKFSDLSSKFGGFK